MPIPTEYFFWMIPQPGKQKPYRTRWRMTREEALSRYPDATPDLHSREVRHLEAPGEETHTVVGQDGVRTIHLGQKKQGEQLE